MGFGMGAVGKDSIQYVYILLPIALTIPLI